MPISGPASYPVTTDEFLAHWLAADTALGAGNEIVLPGAVVRAGLQTKRDLLGSKRTDVQVKLNLQELARGDIELRKAALLLRVNQFNDKVSALHPNTKWVRALPQIPGIGYCQSNFTDPLDDANSLWQLINADATLPDITLLGGYLQANFASDIAALKTAYTTYIAAAVAVTITIEERNDLQDEIYPMLKNYRQVMPTYFAKTHALVESLPRLTPEPGSTPDPVTANGAWDATQVKAKITWSASSNANLLDYEIRFCAGPNYSTENESVAGSVSPTAPREFLSDAGLTTPGSVATFKVYVLTSTGNEKGSNTVVVTRP